MRHANTKGTGFQHSPDALRFYKGAISEANRHSIPHPDSANPHHVQHTLHGFLDGVIYFHLTLMSPRTLAHLTALRKRACVSLVLTRPETTKSR